jgi:hypothetical protein
VHLDLVHHRRDAGDLQRVEVVRVEVGDPDRAHPARGALLDQHLPGVHEALGVHRERPVDQHQVEVVGAEVVEAAGDRVAGGLRGVGAVGELGGEVHLPARQAAGCHRLADAALVAVHLGGVDVPVARLQRRQRRRLRCVRRDLPRAEAELGDRGAVGQGEGG